MNLALTIVALGGCGADLPPIELVGLEPGWVYNGEDSRITVEGENFYPSVNASSFAKPTVESDFRAWVETDPPTEVEVFPISLTALDVDIPKGIPVGTYDFTVESLDGNRATLVQELVVSDTPAEALSAVVTDGSVMAGDSVVIKLEVLDPDGQPVLPFSIQVDVSIVEGTGVELESGTLADQMPLAGGGIRGTLVNQGSVRVTTDDAGDVTLKVAPSDPTSSVRAADDVALNFSSGSAASLTVVVEDDPDAIVAGEPVRVRLAFLDEQGNEAKDAYGQVLLGEACGSMDDAMSFEITGSRTVEFPLYRATGDASDGCPENRLLAFWSDLDGESQALTVLPGDAAELSVSVLDGVLNAGVRERIVGVTMEDAYGNQLPDYETVAPDLALWDNVGGLDPGDGKDGEIGWQSCDPFESGVAVCTVELWKVGTAVTITARDGKGLVGESSPFEVVPGAPAEIQVQPESPLVQAGDDLQVRIHVTDSPGNATHIDPSELHITDETEATLDCQYDGIDPTISYEVHVFECRFTQVGTHRVVVDMASEGLYDFESSDIAVQNGELSQISIDLGSTTTVGAGVTFYADFVGTDAWGNPYVVQTDPYVDVSDATGTATPLVVRLDATGRALDEPMNVKQATLSNRIVAAQSGAWLGSSAVFAVAAGPFEELFVDVDGPVVSVDDPGIVLVSAVDQYGNAVSSYDGAVDLSSTSGLGNPVTITSWVDGRAAVQFPFDVLGVQDTLVADDGVHIGESDPFDVVDFGCAAGPTANLEVGSGLPVRLCLVAGMGATSFDLSSSAAGAEPIELYYYERGDGSAYRTGASGWSTTWTQPGGYAVSGIVVDRDLCASASSGWVYVGYADGQPVGPVDVSIASGATSVHADGGWVTVDVSAWTCTGDAAIDGALLASVDIGDLVPSGANRETGTGIELALDASGTASIQWSMLGQPAGGVATFVAGVRSGAAHGEVSIDIEGDSSHPTVLEVGPVGTHPDVFDSMAILFSDPMQATSISSSSVVLLDPGGTLIPFDDVALASSGPNEGRELLLRFEEQTGTAGAYTLRLTSDLRKAPGPYDNANTLDGNYLGGSDDFVVTFGGVTDEAPDVLTCDPSTPLIRPDGDDNGQDPFEADVVELDLVASGPAAWWLLEVFDLFGNRVDISHVAAAELDVGIIEWDGRGSDGTILDNGTYVVAVTAKDASWNEGAPCLANVTIDNVLVPVDE